MRATLIDANGVQYDLDDLDVSRSLAEQRPDLVSIAMPAYVFFSAPTDTPMDVDTPPPGRADRQRLLDLLRPAPKPNEATIPLILTVNAPCKVPNPVVTPPPIRGKNKRRRGRR